MKKSFLQAAFSMCVKFYIKSGIVIHIYVYTDTDRKVRKFTSRVLYVAKMMIGCLPFICVFAAFIYVYFVKGIFISFAVNVCYTYVHRESTDEW